MHQPQGHLAWGHPSCFRPAQLFLVPHQVWHGVCVCASNYFSAAVVSPELMGKPLVETKRVLNKFATSQSLYWLQVSCNHADISLSKCSENGLFLLETYTSAGLPFCRKLGSQVCLLLAVWTRPPDSVVLCPSGWQGAKCSFPLVLMVTCHGCIPCCICAKVVWCEGVCGARLKIQDELGLHPLQTDFGLFPEM